LLWDKKKHKVEVYLAITRKNRTVCWMQLCMLYNIWRFSLN